MDGASVQGRQAEKRRARDPRPAGLRLFAVVGLAWITAFSVSAQPSIMSNATDDCDIVNADNQYTVYSTCMKEPFYLHGSRTASNAPGGGCGFGDEPDAYGWFMGTGDRITVDFHPNNKADAVLYVYSGNCAAMTLVDCSDRTSSSGGASERVIIDTDPGQTYIIRVAYKSDDGPIPYGDVCLYSTPPTPFNDDPCGAVFLNPASGCVSVSSAGNTSATPTVQVPPIPDPPSGPNCWFGVTLGGQPDPDIWFKTVMPSTGKIVVDSYEGYSQSNPVAMDAGMALYTASGCNAIDKFLLCDDDGHGWGSEMPKLVYHLGDVPNDGLHVGDTVYIRFWAYYDAEVDFEICTAPDFSVLPVELLFFQTEVRGQQVLLEWATGSEKNADHFVVERSNDAHTFQPIGRVQASGNSSQRNDYSFVDIAPRAGINYYRLNQVDYDGSEDHSYTQVAYVLSSDDMQVSVFPNPATDQLNVSFAAPVDGKATVQITDALGRTVSTMQVAGTDATLGTAMVPLHGLEPGWYRVRVLLSNGSSLRAMPFLKH